MRILLLAAVVLALVLLVLGVLGYRRWVAGKMRLSATWERNVRTTGTILDGGRVVEVEVRKVARRGARVVVYDRFTVGQVSGRTKDYDQRLADLMQTAFERCLTLNATV